MDVDVERAATGSGQRVDVSYCCSVTILALAPTIHQTRPRQPAGALLSEGTFDENKQELDEMSNNGIEC